MLSHLSDKFHQSPKQQTHEPRAALFLNRFTRTLTIMYATTGIEKILGISGEEMKGRSFYYCIQENCLDDAVRCLESAKGNDSIAYLRFWFRDPRIDDPPPEDNTDTETDTDVSMTDATSEMTEDDEELGGGQSSSPRRAGTTSRGETPHASSGAESAVNTTEAAFSRRAPATTANAAIPASRTSSGESSNTNSVGPGQTYSGIFEGRNHTMSNSSRQTSPPTSPDSETLSHNRPGDERGIELEAVVSCTSDGLVVCLRRARPVVPTIAQQPAVHQPSHASGIFAAPWAVNPVFHPSRPNYQYYPLQDFGTAQSSHARPYAGPGMAPRPRGPPAEEVFNSIRDVAIFAWALAGINGSLTEYARNPARASGESQPPDGLPVWEGAHKAYGDGLNHDGSSARHSQG